MIPAMFIAFYTQLEALNVMHLGNTAQRHPLGDHLQRADHRRADPAGAQGHRLSADEARHVAAGGATCLIYGVCGGIVAPFVGIKLIDMIVTTIGLA